MKQREDRAADKARTVERNVQRLTKQLTRVADFPAVGIPVTHTERPNERPYVRQDVVSAQQYQRS